MRSHEIEVLNHQRTKGKREISMTGAWAMETRVVILLVVGKVIGMTTKDENAGFSHGCNLTSSSIATLIHFTHILLTYLR